MAIMAETDFLPELAEGWAEEPAVNRDVWHMEWWELMGRLKGLDHYYRSGAMSLDQEARYQQLLRKLKKVLPIMRQLDLPLPPVSLDL